MTETPGSRPPRRRTTRITRDGAPGEGHPDGEVRRSTSTPLPEEAPEAGTRERRAEARHNDRGRGGRAGAPSAPTEEDKRDYTIIIDKIRTGIAALADDADAMRAAPLLYGPDPEAATMLDRLGITPHEYTKFADLHKRFFGMPVKDIAQQINNAYLAEKLQSAAEDLSIQNVIKRFFVPDEHGVILGEEKRKELHNVITKYFYHFFEEVDKNPSKLYNDIYEPFVHGYYINGLEGLLAEISSNRDIRTLLEHDKTDARQFVSELGGYAKTLKNFGQLFHDLPIYALNPDTHEQWKGFIANLYPSELARFFSDPIMQHARTEITRYLKQRITENGNQIPENIFDGRYNPNTVTYQFTDHNNIRANLSERLRDLGIDAEAWEIDRAISYGRGIGLLNLQDIQTMGLGDPNPSIRDIPGLIGKMWQRHKWKQGRGGKNSHLHVKEVLTMGVVHNPESRSYIRRLFKRRKWIPANVHHLAEKKVKELGDELDYKLLDREGTFQELMNVLNLGDQFTRGGWRIEHLLPGGGEVKSDFGIRLMQTMIEAGIPIKEGNSLESRIDWGTREWHKFYDIVTKELGSGALNFYLDRRVKAESYKMLGEALNLGTDYHKIEEAVEEYTEKHSFKKIKFKNGQTMTYYDMKQKIEAEIKGENMYYLFRRSPGDFLLNLNLLVPDLRNPDSKLWGDKKDFTLQEHLIFEKWGDRNSLGFKKLEEIKNWYISVVDKHKMEDRFINHPELEGINPSHSPAEYKKVQIRLIMRHVTKELGTSYERVKARGGVDITRDDVVDVKIRELLFDDPNALMPNLKSNEPRFQFGNEDRLTDKNFFYLMGRGWVIKNGADNPGTTDLDFFKTYEEISKVGQGMFRRLHSDLNEWDGVVKQVANLDELLMHAGTSGNMNEIYKLHGAIHGLEGIAGKEAIAKANYLLASLVTQYFWQHSSTRGLGGIIKTFPARMMLGKHISLSKIHGGKMAMSWDDKTVRAYFYNLAHEHHAIEKEGRWSYEQGKIAFDASTDTHITNQIISASTLLFFYLIFAAAKKAMEEESGKKR